MRLIFAIILTAVSASAFAAGDGTSFSIGTPLPQPAASTVETDFRSNGTLTVEPESVKATSGIPGIPTGGSDPVNAEGAPKDPSPPQEPVPLVPGAPAKVYSNLGQAAADGVNPLATAVTPTASVNAQSTGVDTIAKFIVEHIVDIGAGILALVSVGTLFAVLRRRRAESKD
jgi:hypothetical protein